MQLDLYNGHNTHTHPFNGPLSGTRKVKPIWILLKQESGSGICWAICKPAPRSRQITTPAPHRWVFLQAGCPSCHPTNSVKALKAKALKAKYNGRKMVVIQLVLVIVVDDAQEHWSVALRQVAKSCFIRHHRSRRTVLLPVCRLWQIDLLELELITWLKHKSQKHCWGTSSQFHVQYS